LSNLIPPTSISELRRVIGLFVVSRKYVKNFAHRTKPLSDLLRGQQPVFKWEKAQQDAYDDIRDLLLSGIHLAAPDYSLPFHLATDASEDGKGAVLYQLPDIPIVEQSVYCSRVHSPDHMAIIQFLSKCWTDTEKHRPPFYLEADALLWAMDKTKFYSLSSPFPLYTYSDHLPLQWMNKSTKGPVSQFIIENLSEIENVHQYIQGSMNSISDALSRYPLLGPKQLAPRGLSNCVTDLLSRLPSSLKSAKVIHVHAGSFTSELRQLVQTWSEISNNVEPHSPVRRGSPKFSNLAILVPRPEVSPVTLALYLLSKIPFGILIPVDLLDQAYSVNLYPNSPSVLIREKFEIAGKLTILATQMTWVIGNIPDCTPGEIFATVLQTNIPIPGSSTMTYVEDVPESIEDWIQVQEDDPSFAEFSNSILNSAVRNGLYILAEANKPPLILVPRIVREPLIRATHVKMFHLGSDKVAAALRKQYFWPSLTSDTRKILKDCPDCELEKARQMAAHGLFSARPFDAPRSRWAMDFQGQGKATSGETEALALIDTTARYVIVLPLVDREASTFIQPFLDKLVFVHGPPDILHSDAAPEFLSEALRLLTESIGISTTTTLGHAANANGSVEVFWRYWNRCMRLLPDDLYAIWPVFTSRICWAYNTAIHSSIGNVSPFEVYYGVPARDFITSGLHHRAIDDELDEVDLNDPSAFAIAVKVSVEAFTLLAKNHTDFVRQSTAERMNLHGYPKTYVVGDLVKIRVPPTHEQMLKSGRRSSHISSWRGPCIVTTRLSTTAYEMIEQSSGRQFERLISNMLPYRATSSRSAAVYVPIYSDPFLVDEFIAIRDEPNSPFYIAKVTDVTDVGICVHYYGCTNPDISRAIFRPAWHLPNSDVIILANSVPDGAVKYSGVIQFESLRNLLVARNLEMISSRRLRKKSQKLLFHIYDELFIFNR
jgi:hypothetical protein